MRFEPIIKTIAPDSPVLIAGPTASGKSALALELAAAQGGVIVNADALQVYECWRIITARPSAAEEASHRHALYGHVARHAPYSVGHWLRDVAQMLAGSERLIIVGGTGLYFTALTEGLSEIPLTPAAIRTLANARLAAEGTAGMLAELDPDTYARIDRRNPARVQRAWEVAQTTGRGLASWQDDTAPPLLPLHAVQAFVMRPDAGWLAQRIDSRFDAMIAAGALDEVRREHPHWVPNLPSARAIGAPELMAHLNGELSLEAAIEAAKAASRLYAKRQRTWFRSRMGTWQSVPLP